ncbi:hypothetical protein M409DRAFT_23254 [Zasmidium cellare ATCC 36951]|uniref:Uncharacterized protein n=1 Tax=Zasmidium cellare ATCC 36951 TaxID=1080233 RepID=A0A6A6CKD8_ZASCE|nr:uncharacterized protein M409DRAFT_23254 [Zasmidium cellare ATCC 36951]KAF2166620.1 hypothetical protein M409DRAFT_23254 [Zasmidium cellare ATCC 36951]
MAPDPAVVVALDHIAHPPDIAPPPPPDGPGDTPTPFEATTNTDIDGDATKKLGPFDLPHEPQDPVEATSNTDIDGDTPKKISLFDLPVELQDAIFDYAYPPIVHLKLTTKACWEADEYYRCLRRDTHQIRPFPDVKISEFLVSKKFFGTAIEAWMRNQWIQAGSVVRSHVYGDGAESVITKKAPNIIVAHTYDLILLKRCFSAVKRLKLIVDVGEFQELAPRLPWEVVYDDDEIKTTETSCQVSQFRGLISFEVDPAERYISNLSSHTESRSKTWRQNVKKFGDLVKPLVMLPADPSSPDPPRGDPLSSDLLPQDMQSKRKFMNRHMEEDEDNELKWAAIEIAVWRVLGITAACVWLAKV